MFHTGLRRMFASNRDALSKILRPEALRLVAFGHFEADECGAMNEWLEIAPHAAPAHGQTGVAVSLSDFADRPPRILGDGEVIDLGGKRVRFIDTPHTPHRPRPHRVRHRRPGVKRRGPLPLLQPQPRHGNDAAETLCAEPKNPRPHAWTFLLGRRRHGTPRSGSLTISASRMPQGRSCFQRPPKAFTIIHRDTAA